MSAQRVIRIQPPEAATGEVIRDSGLAARFDAIRAEQEVPTEFPAPVQQEAAAVAAEPLSLPETDSTDIPFITIDPPGSMDLDQAMHLERDGDGYRVRYAIAHLPSFVTPGGAIDAEARRRGQTIYAPDERTSLHPPVVSEGPASLLPDQVTPAYVWDLRLDGTGELVDTAIAPALVRSTARHDYDEVQGLVDSGEAPEVLALLKEIGEKRIALEQERGGATLPMPEQEVEVQPDGTYRLTLRPMLPSEDWNAQISLLTGIAAAGLMISAKIGVLRTMPEPEESTIQRFRSVVRGAGVEWPKGDDYGDLLRSLDREDPLHLALIHEATGLFRGASYSAFDGELPELLEQSAIGAPYAHVTAPLRRLVDRFGLAACAAISAGQEVPAWVREALPELPDLMSASDRRAAAVERASTDAVEAAALADEVGSEHPAVVVDTGEGRDGKGDRVDVQFLDRAILHRATLAEGKGSVELGERVTVSVIAVDVAAGVLDLQVS